MVIKNKLGKPFGPAGSASGIFLFIAGLAATYFSLIGLIFVVAGAFAGFTSTVIFLDIEKRKVKSSDSLFGIIPLGKWIDIQPGMMLGLKRHHRGYRTYSKANRSIDIHVKDIRIMLYGPDKKEILPIKKFSSMDAARADLAYLSQQMGLDCL